MCLLSLCLPRTDKVVGSTALAGPYPAHVPHLQYEAPHQPRDHSHQVTHRQAEDQARKLTITKSGTIVSLHHVLQNQDITYFVLLNKMTGNADKFVMSARARRRERATIFCGEPCSISLRSGNMGSSDWVRKVGDDISSGENGNCESTTSLASDILKS